MEQIILDVRETNETAVEHIPDSAFIPLSQFDQMAPGIIKTWTGKNLLIMCQGGTRAKMAQGQIDRLGLSGLVRTEVFLGGLIEWKKQGRPVTTLKKTSSIPIMRQTQIVAGAGVLSSVLLSAFVNTKFLWLAGFFGAGLTFAGLSGFCGMAVLLGKMPWNQSSRR